jgi:hypothetical protein
MAAPEVPIDVDPETGIWRTDGLPMIYVPRHFLVNLQKTMEAEVGPARFRELFYASAELSARQWCAAEAKTHGLAPINTFRHYLRRMSQRGHGRFALARFDRDAGEAEVVARNSAFALGYGPETGRKVCVLLEGSFAGGVAHVLEGEGIPGTARCEEVACLAEGHPDCRFAIRWR